VHILTININVNDTRKLICSRYHLGTIGENNATILHFIIPKELNGYAKTLIFKTNNGKSVCKLESNDFKVPNDILTDIKIEMQLVLTDTAKTVVWISEPYVFVLNQSLDTTGNNLISDIKDKQKESDRTDLVNSLTKCDINNGINPPSDYDKDWSVLMDIVENTGLLTDGQKKNTCRLSNACRVLQISTAASKFVYWDTPPLSKTEKRSHISCHICTRRICHGHRRAIVN
jgi:hypothetical protein